MFAYHWNELWRSLLGLLKFLLAKSEDLTDLNGVGELATNVAEVLAASLAGGETFLPGTTDYDDLFYKLVQATTVLEQFSQTCTYLMFPKPNNNRLWQTPLHGHDDIIKCMHTLPIVTIGTSEDVKIPTFIIGGSNPGH